MLLRHACIPISPLARYGWHGTYFVGFWRHKEAIPVTAPVFAGFDTINSTQALYPPRIDTIHTPKDSDEGVGQETPVLCIPIFCATVFYTGALIGAYGVAAYGVLTVQLLIAGDIAWVYSASMTTLSYFATKEFASKCFEAIRIVRGQIELRHA